MNDDLKNAIQNWAQQSILYALNERCNDVPFEVIEQQHIKAVNLSDNLFSELVADDNLDGLALTRFTTKVFDWIEGHRRKTAKQS